MSRKGIQIGKLTNHGVIAGKIDGSVCITNDANGPTQPRYRSESARLLRLRTLLVDLSASIDEIAIFASDIGIRPETLQLGDTREVAAHSLARAVLANHGYFERFLESIERRYPAFLEQANGLLSVSIDSTELDS